MYKFIIVDDEQLIRKGILKKIEKFDLGLQFVGEAENGEDALELIKSVNPQIVLTDMRMPLMDGKTLLKKLQQDFPKIKTIVISGYSDFEYLQVAISSSAVDYILKPFNREEIYTSFAKAITFIDKELSVNTQFETIEVEKEKAKFVADVNYISDLITSSQNSYDLEELISKGTIFIKDSDSYVLISIYSVEKSSEAIYSILSNLPNSSDNFLPIPALGNHNIGFFLGFFKGHSESHVMDCVKEQIEKIYEYFKTISKEHLYISISNINSDMNFIHSAYLQSISLLDKRDVKFDKTIFYADKTEISTVELEWPNMDRLMFFIESGNILKVQELLNDFFIELEQLSPLTIATIKYNCQLIFANLRNILKSHYDILKNHALPNTYEHIINNTFDFKTIKICSEQLLSNVATLLKEKNIYPSDDLINNIKRFIQKNYTENITLEKMSSLFFINPSYCSFLFKEKTGENLIDYVNKIRIEKAKELLKNTDYKVYKIAKMLGYDNDKYFFRVFKKVTGYTPEEYRVMQSQG